ncbi:unnamed protein product [Prunus armeniaca]
MVNMVQIKEKKENKKNTMTEKGKSGNTEKYLNRKYKKWLDKQKTKDSGASIHVANSLQGFIRRRLPRKDEVKVFVGNGEKVQVEFIGTFLSIVEKDRVLASSMVAEDGDGSSNVREVWKLSFK